MIKKQIAKLIVAPAVIGTNKWLFGKPGKTIIKQENKK